MRKKLPILMLSILVATAVALAQSSSRVLELISVSSAGVQGDSSSGTFSFTTPNGARASVTADGRFVAYMSFAENLVPGDTNLSGDVFVRDRVGGTTERVSVTSRGREGNNHSGITSAIVDISDNGRFVAFDSEATNLARGDDNANAEVFVHDRTTRETELISRGLDGNPATGDSPAISADGRFVAFISSSQTLMPNHPEFDLFRHAYVYDRQAQVFEQIDVDSNEALRSTGVVHVAISADGRYVAFDTFSDTLVPGPGDQEGTDVFVRDRLNGTTEGISTAGDTGGFEGNTFLSSISANGRFVGFTSDDPNFAGDTNGFISDAFVFDRQAGSLRLVSRSSAGVQGNDQSESPFVSDDGTWVVFSSRASNLVANDTNQAYDVFRRNLVTNTTERLAGDDQPTGSHTMGTGLTPDGLVVPLITGANLLPEDNGLAMDVYVVDMRPAADLAVTQTDSPDPVPLRGQLTYTVTVRNLGPGNAGQVTLTDQLPAQAVFQSATPAQGTCTRQGQGSRDGVLTCQLGSINAFASVTVVIVVSPSTGGVTLTNVATVQSNVPDPNGANNTAVETTTVPPK
jgi:uncharacterized repeat protein (TIGR01451 family)